MSVGFSVRGLHKVFETDAGPLVVLEDVSFEVPTSSFVALIGPSGCGKSTLLNILAGLDTSYEGTLDLSKEARKSYLFQSPRLLLWATAEQNVAFVLRAQNVDKDEARAKARRYLELVGLEGFEQSFPSHLSGGMQQRVAMARALVVDPDVALMDEPLGALDELTARKLRTELIGLYAETTVLFVTHNVTEAVYLADRVLVMSPRPGRIVAEVDIELPRPRDYEDADLTTYTRQIIQSLGLG